MLSSLPVAFAALLSFVSAVSSIPTNWNVSDIDVVEPMPTGLKCGSHLTPEAVSEKENSFASLLAEKKASNIVTASQGPFTVPVLFHVIHAGMDIAEGYVPDSQIQAQIDVLNQDYSGSGLIFQLQNTTRTLAPTWFNIVAPDTDLQTAMKNALRQGDAKTLNLYTVGFNTGDGHGLLGYSTFPVDYAANPMDDGVVVLYSSLPGGSMTGFNLGRTSTHEIGHWLGLYHTFQGGCNGSGDFVNDTPAEASPASGCPIGRDTCSANPGLDPVQNFMDYSNDMCMTNFTPGQITRLKSQISAYRGINL
jgi:hypothetical protein